MFFYWVNKENQLFLVVVIQRLASCTWPKRILDIQLTALSQLKQAVSILGEGVSSALESKVVFLNKIGKVSSFLEGVISIGGALSGVSS